MDEVLDIANRKDLAETGGGHNQKGVDFQRHWAVMRMFHLEQDGAPDFLFLFEIIQDVAELDSSSSPTSIHIYQVKKNDRSEWTWKSLTKLEPPTKKSSAAQSLSEFKNSPLGKLYASVIAFKTLKSTGRFVSNSGCDLPLSSGANAATSVPCDLSLLSAEHLGLLAKGLETLHAAGMPPPDLSRLGVERVVLPPDDPGTHLVGVACKFLRTRSPRHAGQAAALVDSLMAKVGPLGTRTDTCKTYEDIRRTRGFSKEEFVSALGDLENLPDLLEYLNEWLAQLVREGMTMMEQTAIKAAAARIFRYQVMGAPPSPQEAALLLDCDTWIESNALSPSITLLDYFTKAYDSLGKSHPVVKKSELLANFALRAIKKCVAPT